MHLYMSNNLLNALLLLFIPTYTQLILSTTGLERCFLEIGVQCRLPNLAFGHSGDVEGYSFKTEFAKKCSYLHVLDILAKLTERGSEDFSMKSFYNKKFMLPFKLSASPNNMDSATREKVQQSNITPVSNQRRLFLKFAENTSYTITVSVIYFQHRSIKINREKKVFKSFDIDQ